MSDGQDELLSVNAVIVTVPLDAVASGFSGNCAPAILGGFGYNQQLLAVFADSISNCITAAGDAILSAARCCATDGVVELTNLCSRCRIGYAAYIGGHTGSVVGIQIVANS